jgi:hypothetical protein
MKIVYPAYRLLFSFLLVQSGGSRNASAATQNKIIDNAWQPLPTLNEGGTRERVNLWRKNRLWDIAGSGYLLGGFESRPGVHPWLGEHVGK